MTTYETREIDFDAVSEPISGETRAVVRAVAESKWWDDAEWEQFKGVCRAVAYADNDLVDPNLVRPYFQDAHGDMESIISPRRYSAFWSRAAGKNGFLVADGWVTNDDTKGGNRGKPLRRYRLRT